MSDYEQVTLAEVERRYVAMGFKEWEAKKRCDACGRDLRRPDEKRRVFWNGGVSTLLCGTCHSELDRDDIRIRREPFGPFPGVHIRWPREEDSSEIVEVHMSLTDILDALDELQFARTHLDQIGKGKWVPEAGEYCYKCRDRIDTLLKRVKRRA